MFHLVGFRQATAVADDRRAGLAERDDDDPGQ
jgi:hypothetical protein